MEYQVPVIVEPLDEGGYYAEYPILQGCHVEGKTYLQTLEYLEDVIRIHIEGRLKFGQPLPYNFLGCVDSGVGLNHTNPFSSS